MYIDAPNYFLKWQTLWNDRYKILAFERNFEQKITKPLQTKFFGIKTSLMLKKQDILHYVQS